MPALFDPAIIETFSAQRTKLINAQFPIVTIPQLRHQITFARSLARSFWQQTSNNDAAWIVDPSGFCSPEDWLTQPHAQHSDIQQPTRSQSSLSSLLSSLFTTNTPMLQRSQAPLLYLLSEFKKPIISFHPEVSATAAQLGIPVLHVVTQPPQEPDFSVAHLPLVWYAVPDLDTQITLQEGAVQRAKIITDSRIHITGLPTDPYINEYRVRKVPWRSGPLKIVVHASPHETDQQVIKMLIDELFPILHSSDAFQLIVLCNNDEALRDYAHKKAQQYSVPISDFQDDSAHLRITYSQAWFENENILSQHALPWADLAIMPPTHDLMYDSLTAGCALLVFDHTPQSSVGSQISALAPESIRLLHTKQVPQQLELLKKNHSLSQSWIEVAMQKALTNSKINQNTATLFEAAYSKLSAYHASQIAPEVG